MINECEMKNLDGTVAQENYGVLSDRHKPWTANCFLCFTDSIKNNQNCEINTIII